MKKSQKQENYLERKPIKNQKITWTEKGGIVTLEIKNEGLMNKLAQKIFKKPEISYVHLDEMGSFVWQLIDGKKTILEFSDFVKEKFGEKAQPLYERLAKYFQILESYSFIAWN